MYKRMTNLHGITGTISYYWLAKIIYTRIEGDGTLWKQNSVPELCVDICHHVTR